MTGPKKKRKSAYDVLDIEREEEGRGRAVRSASSSRNAVISCGEKEKKGGGGVQRLLLEEERLRFLTTFPA